MSASDFFKQLYEARFGKRGGRLSCVYYDENTLNINAPYEMEGLASCLDYFRAVTNDDPVSARIQAEYDKEFPGKVLFAAGSDATGMYRGIMLSAAAVKEAKSVDRAAVAAALDHAKIAEGPGGPTEMIPSKQPLQDEDVYGRGEERELRDCRGKQRARRSQGVLISKAGAAVPRCLGSSRALTSLGIASAVPQQSLLGPGRRSGAGG